MSSVRKTLLIYRRHAARYKALLLGIIGIMPLLQLVDNFIVPILVSRILNKLAKIHGAINFGEFTRPILLILAIELGVNLFWRPYIRLVWTMEEKVMKDLYMSSFTHLMKMSYSFFNNRFSGSIVSQVNKFAGSFERLADTMVWNVYPLIISVILTAVLMVGRAPLYVLTLIIFSAVFVILLVRLKRNEQPYNQRWAAAETKRTGQLADTISNILTVKAYANENIESSLFLKSVDGVVDESLSTMDRVLKNERYTSTSQRSINAGAILSAIFLAAHSSIPLGTVYLILIYTLNIARGLWDLNTTVRNLNRVFGDARDMTEILDVRPEVDDPANAKRLRAVRGDINFDNITFAHAESRSRPLFKNFSLHIKPGEKVGLIGHSGGGKTTLVQLLLRFIDVNKGRILIDGQSISSIKQTDLRKAVAYVQQEPLMFHRSITENIMYGQPRASQKEVISAAKMANAHGFIQQLPKGYDTLVGERGTKLSGGQRQRIAIARAMLKNAPVLLLDEATSALDSESEGLIQVALWRLMENKTTIAIAHRLSTIQRMDRIIVLEEGDVAEEGSHRELLKLDGIYADLWARQSGGFLEN